MADYKAYGMRLEAGQELIQSVQDAFASLAASFCDVNGFGALRRVTLQAGDDEDDEQYFEGPLQLVDFKGRLRQAGDLIIADYFCTLSRLTDNGVELLGGKITDADIEFVELTFFPVEMMASQPMPTNPAKTSAASSKRPSVAPPPGPPPQPPPRKRGPTPPAAPAPNSSPEKRVTTPVKQTGALSDRWAKAVLESKKVLQEADFVDDGAPDERPSRGDIVIHQQFGECKVTRIDDDHITLRKPDGRNVQLGILILRFSHAGERNGKDLFNVEVSPKR